MVEISRFKKTKNQHYITSRYFVSIVAVPQPEELFILRPSVKTLESESEKFHFEESYVDHIDERSSYTFQTNRNWII